jgi:hypothetical protein
MKPSGLVLALALFVLTASGCGGDGEGIREGHYIGDLVSFRLDGLNAASFRIAGIDCSIPHPDYPVVSLCVNRPAGIPLDTLTVSPTGNFEGQVGDIWMTGTITASLKLATGTWRYESTCFLPSESACVTEGVWDADWREVTVSQSEPDAGSAPDIGVQQDAVIAPPITGTPDSGDPGPIEFPTTAADHQKEAAQIFAKIRGLIGHFAVPQDSGINAAAQAHADYYALHAMSYNQAGLSAHQQNAEWTEGFVGVNVGDRLTHFGVSLGGGWSEVMAFSGTVQGSFDGWMETLYHRIPLVHPNTAVWGYGLALSGADAEVLDSIYGSAESSDPGRWPVPWATDVYRSWGGWESPQPPLPSDEVYPSGPIITITFANGTAPEVFLSAELTGPDGVAVPIQIQTPQNDSWLKTTWAVYSYDPLQFSSTYTVTFRGKRGGTDYTDSWSFTTE